MKFLCANRIAPDGMPRSVASHLELFSLPISHKKDNRLKSVKPKYCHNKILTEHSCEKTNNLGFQPDPTNRPVQSQKQARSWKFRIKEKEGLC